MIEHSIIWNLKLIWYWASVAVFQYLSIPTEQFWILAVLMIIDFITWVWKQFRIDRKEIKSHIAWLWAMKKIATLLVVLSIWLVMKWLSIEEHKYVEAVLAIFIMSEWYSTLQNIYAIRTGKILPEFDVISIAIKTIWEYFKLKIENMVKNQPKVEIEEYEKVTSKNP